MSRRNEPKSGLLSNMALPGALLLALVGIGTLHRPALSALSSPPSPKLLDAFLLSVVAMALHKIESYFAREYDHCPVYRTAGRAAWAQDPKRAIFVAFVPTFVLMLLIVYAALAGPPWPLALLAVWAVQGLHEIHHAAKSAARRALYPGTLSALLFVAVVAIALFPRWHDLVFAERGLLFLAYYLSMPAVFALFYLEDRRWRARSSG